MITSKLLLECLFMQPTQWRLRMPMLAFTVALSGCAVQEPDQKAMPPPLVAYTTVGSGQPHRAQPYTAPVDSSQTRSRNLSPIRERPSLRDKAVQDRPSAQQAGQQTTLNFNGAELHGVLRALAQFTGRNFVVDPRVRGQLTLISETPVDADTAYSMLLSALRMQGFAVVDVDGVSRVCLKLTPSCRAALSFPATSVRAAVNWSPACFRYVMKAPLRWYPSCGPWWRPTIPLPRMRATIPWSLPTTPTTWIGWRMSLPASIHPHPSART